MAYFVYVLKSENHGTRYIGTAGDVLARLQEHNRGRCRYTSGRRPWKVVYQEEYATLSEARKREVYLKSGVGRKDLDKIL